MFVIAKIPLDTLITNRELTLPSCVTPAKLLSDNIPNNRKLDQFIHSSSSFIIAYINLSNFKPYIDYYGDKKGGQIIAGIESILRDVVTDKLDFIGHIGGDDFIIITTNRLWESVCDEILTQFSEWVRHRYLPEDQMMGGISASDQFGQKQFYPMICLSIDCVALSSDICKNYHDVTVLASEIKLMAKQFEG